MATPPEQHAARRRRRRRDRRVCPITLRPVWRLRCPVRASDNVIYEAEALERWAAQNPTSPCTREALRYGVPLTPPRRAPPRPVGEVREVREGGGAEP